MYEELTPSKANFSSHQTKVSDIVANGIPPPDVLRKELENELRSDKKDIRSYPWYHGKVPREVAEDLMTRDGDFLIRESVTNVGDYVLTCKYKSAYYHFKINKVFTQKSPTYSTVQYCLEEQYFESLPGLVYSYVGEKIPVSKKTGVVLGQPVNRAIPISYSDVKYASLRRQPKGKSPGGSVKHWNNSNNNTSAGKGASPAWHSSISSSISSSPSSSVSSMESHDKSGLGPRTPSPHQINTVYATPRSPATSISPHQRKTSDPLPGLPEQGAVVLEEHIVLNSYSPTGDHSHAVSYQGNSIPSRTNHTPPPVSPSYNNGPKSHPFPLILHTAGSDQRAPTGSARGNYLKVTTQALNRPASQVDMNIESHGKYVSRTGSDPLLSPNRAMNGSNPSSPHPVNTNNNNNSAFAFQYQNGRAPITEAPKSKTVPPKPSRVPSFKTPVIKGFASSGTNQISSRMGSMKNSVALLADKRMTPPTISEVPECQTMSPDSSVNMRSKPPRSRRTQDLAASKRKRASCFKPAQYLCTMLSPENPPLEQKAITEIKKLLLSTDPFKLARHMTVIDCKVCRIMEGELDRIFLPHASQLRQDIVERYQCIAFWVAICVIKCTNGREERAEVLNMFIQVANELVHSMGNVFGFSAIMHGLTCPQISSLDLSWESLRLKFTNNAVTFEKKLRPLLCLMDEGKGQIRIGATCIPHIMPLVRLLEYPGPGIPHTTTHDSTAKKSASYGSLLDRFSPSTSSGKEDTASLNSNGRDASKVGWWENVPDESFDSLLSHLHSGRSILENLEDFKKNANSKLVDFKEMPKIREMFTTDFQMRLLFGFRSAESPRHDRFHKFDMIISAMRRHIVE